MPVDLSKPTPVLDYSTLVALIARDYWPRRNFDDLMRIGKRPALPAATYFWRYMAWQHAGNQPDLQNLFNIRRDLELCSTTADKVDVAIQIVSNHATINPYNALSAATAVVELRPLAVVDPRTYKSLKMKGLNLQDWSC